jgi:hypothetical protein
LALARAEPRISLVLNWGGVMCGDKVPIYKVETVNEQLAEVSARFLASNLKV